MKKLVLFFLVALLALSAAIPALAQEPQPPQPVNASIEITGDTLSVVPALVDFGVHQLDGADHTWPGQTTDWVAKDPTGTGAGWKVTLSAGDFKRVGDEAGFEKIISNDGVRIKLTDIRYVDGNDVPVSNVTDWTELGDSDVTPVKIMIAEADKGMGTYNFLPEFELAVPAESYAGSYNAVFTVAITAGPN